MNRNIPRHPALAHFRTTDPVLYRAALPHHDGIVASAKHRRGYTKLFQYLAGSIVSQQLSTKAADTIWGRLENACGGEVTPEAILKLRAPTMRPTLCDPMVYSPPGSSVHGDPQARILE